MPMQAEDPLVYGFAVAIDRQQQVAGQTLLRAHKLRLVAQIPGLHRGEIRLRRLAGDIGKADLQSGVMQHDGCALRRRKFPLVEPDGKGGGDILQQRRRNIAFRDPRDDRLLHAALTLPGLFKSLRIGRLGAVGSLFQRLRASRCRAKRCHAFILLSPL